MGDDVDDDDGCGHFCNASINLTTRSAPATCPIDSGRECRLDHREFPSHMNAMCRGRSNDGGVGVTSIFSSILDFDKDLLLKLLVWLATDG